MVFFRIVYEIWKLYISVLVGDHGGKRYQKKKIARALFFAAIADEGVGPMLFPCQLCDE
jgi:hypothetical protein